MLDSLTFHALLPALWALFLVYAFSVTLFLITENRSPSSTLAWLFVMFFFPMIGVLVYLFFGRSARFFQQHTAEARRVVGKRILKVFAQGAASDLLEIEHVREAQSNAHSGRLLELLYRTRSAVITLRNELEILQDASEQYPRLMEDIRQAKQSIHLQYFIWQVDDYTEQVKDLLIEKAHEGVEVRLLYDAVGSFTLDWLKRGYRRALQEAGVQLYPYLGYYSPLTLHTINYRNHRKIAVIDGRIGHTGGLNMGKEHLVGAGPYRAWRDTNVRITGEAVGVLQGIFMSAWYNTTKQLLSGAHYFPPEEEQTGYLPLHLVISGPDSEWSTIHKQYFAMVVGARDHVYIQSPYFIPDASLAEALKVAALSGVDVRLMIAPRDTVNPVPNWAANTYFRDVCLAGARVFLYERGYMHAKTISVDSMVCAIGSANLDIRSFSTNYENTVVIYDEARAQELEEDFRRDLAGCREFSVADYDQTHYFLRLRDSVARLLSPLL